MMHSATIMKKSMILIMILLVILFVHIASGYGEAPADVFLHEPIFDSGCEEASYASGSKLKGITITGSSCVAKGKKINLKAIESPSGAAAKVKWKSDNPKIATVSSKGVVKGVKAGTVRITATSTANKKISGVFTVEVVSKSVKNVTVEKVGDVYVGDQVALIATATPAKAAQSFSWKSGNTKVATVDENGVVTAHSAGKVKMTATATDGTGKKATVTIRVIEKKDEESFETDDLNEKIDWIVSRCITGNMSDKEKAKALHDWIIYHAHYDLTYTTHGPEGVLIKGYGVCESYSKAYSLLLDRVGIPNYIISGFARMPHAWNLVRIGKEWYHVDPTWDDPVTDDRKVEVDDSPVVSGMENSQFFLVSDQYMKEHQHNFIHYASGDYLFEFDGSGVVIDGILNRKIKKVTIPDQIDYKGKRYAVTGVKWEGFYGPENIEGISLPKSVKNIYFANWKSLKTFPWPEGITQIDNETFLGCESLESVEIPAGVKRIGDGAFSGCSSLKTIDIPAKVTVIGKGALAGCKSLKSVTIPKGVTVIEDNTFTNCTGVEEVSLPEGITGVGEAAFAKCESLKEIVLPEGTKIVGDNAFLNCSSLRKVYLPGSVEKIGDQSFAWCNVTELYLPGNVVGMLDEAFACDAIKSLKTLEILNGDTLIDHGFYAHENLETVVLPDSMKTIGAHAFSDCRALKEITFPKGLKSIGEDAFYCCTSLDHISLPETLQRIENYAFDHCTSLKKLSLPSKLQYLGEGVFEGCKVEEIEIPNHLISRLKESFDCADLKTITVLDGTAIMDDAFSDCAKLEKIVLPDSITSIGQYAFCNCISLKTFTLPPRLTTIDTGAFMGCTGLETISIPKGVTAIDVYTFYGCTGLIELSLPEGMTEIMMDAFRECASLKKVSLPESLVSMDGGAFSACNVEEISLPGHTVSMLKDAFDVGSIRIVNVLSGTEISSEAFAECVNLEKVVLPSGITEIGSSAFSGCVNLKEIDIPTAVTNIRMMAFSGCSGLKTVTIPGGVKCLESSAFENCSALEEVHLSEGIEILDAFVFDGCKKLTRIYLPGSLKEIYGHAFDPDITQEVFYAGKPEDWNRIVTYDTDLSQLFEHATIHYQSL